MKLKSKIAVNTAKIASKIISSMGKGSGATLPGLIASKIDPDILNKLASQISKKIIVTMGTNGKTTTNALMYKMLTDCGYKVIINRTGANMLNGITAAFVLASRGGTIDADYAVIEVDEFAAKNVLKHLNPNVILLTNIGRDQLDRFGEVDITLNAIQQAFESVSGSTLVINADDVLSYSMALKCNNPTVTFGINEKTFSDIAKSEIKESIFCRKCGCKLHYDFFHYGQLGVYHCESCDFKRPEPHYFCRNIKEVNEKLHFELLGPRFSFGIEANVNNQYNIYNSLAAFSALSFAGLDQASICRSIIEFDFGNNREETFMVGKTKVQLHLAKNPMGFQQKVAKVCSDPTLKDVIILINDNSQDGEDVSWLWDVDFQHLGKAKIQTLVCAGLRRYDMGLRLKYDGLGCTFTTDMKQCICSLSNHGTGNLYVIVNYTGLYYTNGLLHEMSGKPLDGTSISNAGDTKAEVLLRPMDGMGLEEYRTVGIDINKLGSDYSAGDICVNITHLYPDLLNLYGDRGNIQSMRMRLEWRGIGCNINTIETGDKFDLSQTDIVLLGGGSDREQKIVCDYLINNSNEFERYVTDGGVVLAVCGGYQLLGKYYQTANTKIKGLGIIDVQTNWKPERLVDNIVLNSRLTNREIVGFENHGGRTHVGDENIFGRVAYGYGNEGKHDFEGVVKGNIIATYLHGPLLPKNPELCDWLLQKALDKKGAEKLIEEIKLDDKLENLAAQVIINRYSK